MAEPLSVTASVFGVVAFGQQLAQSIVKIRQFCKDAKNAPAELQELLDELEDIYRIGSAEF